MQLESLRGGVYRILDPLTGWLADRRAHPNLLTTIGFAATMGAAWAFHVHALHTAGFLVLLGGFFDILDGRVARLTGLGSKFGAFYDSTLDRISEIAVYFGMLSLYPDATMTYVVVLAMAGSLMVSYTRARAEALGLDCRVGLMPRAERVVLIGAAALFFGATWDGVVLTGVIVLLAVMTNVTAIQRIIWVYQHARGVPLDDAVAPSPDAVPEEPVHTPIEETSVDNIR
jgi:CDP-diacylglycerol---glycerol-3-phosphate 3-phosphatidyltransferase